LPARTEVADSAKIRIGMADAAILLPKLSLSENRPPEMERIHRKQVLAMGFRLFAQFGFDEGVAGHITARDPERPDHFWVNPFGMDFSLIRASDLILVNESGEVVEGKAPVNRAAFAIHSAIHKARPEVVAAAHAHSMYGKAWSTLGRLLDPITQDACAFYQDHALFDDYTGVVYETTEGDRIANALGQCKALILRNHGLLTVGQSCEEAIWWFITMERSCQAQIAAESVGEPHLITPSNALVTRGQIGSPQAGWFQFQPLRARILKAHPDLLD